LRTPVSASASFFLQDRQTDDTAGPDTLLGGFGADTCGVDDPGDVVVEVNEIQQTQGAFLTDLFGAEQGDTVVASVSFTLPKGRLREGYPPRRWSTRAAPSRSRA